MSDESLRERVVDLEIRLTYQESALNELSDVVVRQQEQIDALLAELRRHKAQLEAAAESVRPLSQEEPPPHY